MFATREGGPPPRPRAALAGMDAGEQRLGRCFVMVRSIWLPTNALLLSSALAAAAGACGATWTLAAECSWIVQAMACTVSAWLLQWLLLHAARDWEDRACRFSQDVLDDRSALPLAVFSLPSSALLGFAWIAIGFAIR